MNLLTNPTQWNDLISPLPGAHILQTVQWAQVKGQTGWQPFYAVWQSPDGLARAASLILERTLRFGGLSAPLRVLYCPRGPLLDWGSAGLRSEVLGDLQSFTRERRALFLKLDPDLPVGFGLPGQPGERAVPEGLETRAELERRGWRFSSDQIQFRNTVLIDLSGPEDALLARMKQKTRYNIRLAEKKGVSVRAGSRADFSLLYRMYAETAVRDGFVIRDERYYRQVWECFTNEGLAEPLIAEVAGEPVAGVFLFHFAGRAWYLYGMSRAAHREKMPTYLLQWEAMRWARRHGCQVYDLWGAPDDFNESDSMWGVFRFKEGLGGEVARGLGAWDWTPQPVFYRLYTQTLPRILDVLRRRGRARTQKEVRSL